MHTGGIRYERWTIADREMSRAAQFRGRAPDALHTNDRDDAAHACAGEISRAPPPTCLQSSQGGLTAAVRVDSASRKP